MISLFDSHLDDGRGIKSGSGRIRYILSGPKKNTNDEQRPTCSFPNSIVSLCVLAYHMCGLL